MKKLIIVRHGECAGRENMLSSKGAAQIDSIARQLKGKIIGSPVLLTSEAPRTSQSACILSATLRTRSKPNTVLWEREGKRAKLRPAELMQLIEESGRWHDTVIVVTHFEYTEELPRLAVGKHFKEMPTLRSMGMGEAIMLDFQDQTIEYFCGNQAC